MFTKMRIATRLMLGFGMLIVFVAGLSGFAYYTGHMAASLFDDVARLKQNEVLSQRVVKRVFEGRMQVIGALITGEVVRWQQFDDAFLRARDRLDQLIAQTADQEQLELTSKMYSLLITYEKETERLRRFQNTNDGRNSSDLKTVVESSAKIGREIDKLGNEMSDSFEKVADEMIVKAHEQTDRMIQVAVLLGTLCVLFGGGFSVVFARSITRPVQQISNVMESLAAGDLSVEVPTTTDKGEIGQMAKAVQAFKEAAIQTEDARAEHEQAKQQGRAPMRWFRG